MNIIEYIDKFQGKIFEFNIALIDKDIVTIIDSIEKIILNFSEEDIILLNEILNHFNAAIVNKDYLLAVDLMEFELKPLIKKNHFSGGKINEFIQ